MSNNVILSLDLIGAFFGVVMGHLGRKCVIYITGFFGYTLDTFFMASIFKGLIFIVLDEQMVI